MVIRYIIEGVLAVAVICGIAFGIQGSIKVDFNLGTTLTSASPQ